MPLFVNPHIVRTARPHFFRHPGFNSTYLTFHLFTNQIACRPARAIMLLHDTPPPAGTVVLRQNFYLNDYREAGIVHARIKFVILKKTGKTMVSYQPPKTDSARNCEPCYNYTIIYTFCQYTAEVIHNHSSEMIILPLKITEELGQLALIQGADLRSY